MDDITERKKQFRPVVFGSLHYLTGIITPIIHNEFVVSVRTFTVNIHTCDCLEFCALPPPRPPRCQSRKIKGRYLFTSPVRHRKEGFEIAGQSLRTAIVEVYWKISFLSRSKQ